MAEERPRRMSGDESLQWHDGRRMVTVWVGRGQQWAGSAREQARRANRRPRNRLQRFALWLVGIPLGLLATALGLAVTILGVIVGIIALALMIWVGMGFAGAAMTSRAGRSARVGWILGLALGPLGLLIIRRLA